MSDISIIVPIYNVEKYLNQCVESIVRQTFYSIEIILVDDGSTDSSGIIADQWSTVDSRIKVIHKKNGGQSLARNIGLKAACSPWVFFVDSDDWLDLNAIQYVFENIQELNVDMVLFDYFFEFPEYKKQKVYSFPIIEQNVLKEMDIKRYILPYFVEGNGLNNVWNRVYNRSFLIHNHLQFDETIERGEDEVFNLHMFSQIQTMIYLKKPLYHYRKTNPLSITNTLSRDYLEHILERHFMIKRETSNWVLIEHDKDQLLIKRLYYNLYQWIFLFFNNTRELSTIKKISSIKEILNKLQIKKELKDIDLRNISIKEKILFWMLKHQFFSGIMAYQRLSQVKLKLGG